MYFVFDSESGKGRKKKVDIGFHCCCKFDIASLFSYFSPSRKKSPHQQDISERILGL
jgi:hypothetical protein